MKQPKTLQEYGEAFRDDRKEYYRAMILFASVGVYTMLAVFVYVTILIVEKIMGWL